MILTQKEAVRKSHERYTENLSREPGLFGTDTGHHIINLVAGGHVPTKITTYAGRAGSSGKTASLVPMAAAAGRVLNGKRSELLVGSWEMEASYLIDRYVCYKAGVRIMQLRYPQTLTEQERKAVATAYAEASKFPVHYHQHSNDIHSLLKHLDKFVKMCKEKEIIQGVKIQPVFALDFIGRIKGASRYSSKTYDIENFLQELKQFANDTGLAVYILAQLLRSADEKDKPELMDIKDSAAIEDNSDTLIIAHRPEYYGKKTMEDPVSGTEISSHNKMLWRVVKAREAQPRDVVVNCDFQYFRTWYTTHNWDTEYWQNYSDNKFWEDQI